MFNNKASFTRPGHYNSQAVKSLAEPGDEYLRMISYENRDDNLELSAMVESILFVASGPVTSARIAKVLDTTPTVIENVLRGLEDDYQNRGIRLQHSGSYVQLTTAPGCSPAIERFLGLEVTTRLSHAALEVLAIIAYLQPVTRPHIDSVRGVNSDSTLRTLLNLGLIEEVGRVEATGRPILYGTTPDFLGYFGLKSIEELPSYSEGEE